MPSMASPWRAFSCARTLPAVGNLKNTAIYDDDLRVSKKIVMYILMSIVSSIVMTIGSFTCKDKEGKGKVILIVQHPDSCFLLEPNALAPGQSTSADIVSVPLGKIKFKFDCDGKQVEIEKYVQSGQSMWKVDPLNPGKEE